MKILVTGAAGFIGANLVHRFEKEETIYWGVDDLSFGSAGNLPKAAYVSFNDFGNIADDVINNFDTLIHLATSNIIYAMNNPIETVINNAVKTIELFSRFKGKIIYTSTASIYGNAENIPTPESEKWSLSNGYDTSKYIAEQFLRQRGNFTTLRLSNVYGRFQDASSPYCGVLGKFIDKYLTGAPFTIHGDGSATRDYTYVEDVVDAILLAVESNALNTEINIATGIETSTLFLAELINIDHPVIFGEKRKIDSISRRCLDISKAEKLLEWKPRTPIRDGVQKLIEIKRLNLVHHDSAANV